MNKEEQNYLNILKSLLYKDDVRPDRTGIGVKSIFGTQLRYSLDNFTFPLFTTKKMFFRGIVEELLLFLRGDCDTLKLLNNGISIWKGNTSKEFISNRGLNLPEGNLGKGYPFQYRNYGGDESSINYLENDKRTGIDQIANLIDTLKTNPYDRRMLVSAWNPKQNDEAVLPACHSFFQCYVNNNKLSLQVYLRSSDFVLGYSWNVAYYALMSFILAKVSNMELGELIMTTGDTHLYSNLENVAMEQIIREPFPFPKLKINKDIFSVKDIENLSFNDFELLDYKSHLPIKGKMAI